VNQRIMLTKPVFERLVEHLVFIEENTDTLANFCFPDLPIERENMRKLFREYAVKIEDEFERTVIINSPEKYRDTANLNEFPFVILGSQVRVADQSSSCSTVFKLIHPIEQSSRINEVTCLSALGKALFMKKVGSEAVVDTPARQKRYKIETIRLL